MRLVGAAIGLLVTAALSPARAADGFDLTLPQQAAPAPVAPVPNIGPDNAIAAYFAAWAQRVAHTRATQPEWSSPLVTTTALLEQRVRFDLAQQHAGNRTDTTVIDGGRGLDLIVSDTNEVQIAAVPYDIRTSDTGRGALSGFADWPFIRIEQRLAASPESDGDYVVTAWVAVQAPVGITALTNDAWTYQPTLAFGKGWGRFDIQATVGGVIPASHTAKLGRQIVTNVALQYHVLQVLWPQLEMNWTYYPDGQRGGLNQIYLTPGLVVGRLALTDSLRLTLGVGYQSAVAPTYRAKPLTPGYNHAWLFTSRMSF